MGKPSQWFGVEWKGVWLSQSGNGGLRFDFKNDDYIVYISVNDSHLFVIFSSCLKMVFSQN